MAKKKKEAAATPHEKTCYIGGYRGPTDCCEGNCRHRVNCNCAAGETADREYLLETIRGLRAQIRFNQRRLKILEKNPGK